MALNTIPSIKQLSSEDGYAEVLLDVISGPSEKTILNTVYEQDRTKRTSRQFTAVIDGHDVNFELSLGGYTYDRYSDIDHRHMIVDADIINATAKSGKSGDIQTINVLERAKIFCSRVQLHYNCTNRSGKLRFTAQASA